MTHSPSRFWARIGAGLIIAGLLLPWYKFDMGELAGALGGSNGSLKISGMPTSQSFSAWDSARTVFVIFFLFAVAALGQLPFASPGIMGRVFMFAGFAGVVLLGYKIANPPFDDVLKFLKIGLKPQIGLFVTTIGMAAVAYAGWEQVKRDLAAPSRADALSGVGSDWHTTVAANAANQGYAQAQTVGQAQGYAQPQYQQPPGMPAQAVAQAAAAQPPPAAPSVAQPPQVRPDPFAVQPPQQQPPPPAQPPQAVPPRVVPPDPFAPQPPAGG